MASILAVDDSPSIRAMVQFALESDGHEVLLAEDGLEALKAAKEHQFDAVVTDVNMPNMNGIDLTRELRKLEPYRFIPLLILTTESSTERKQEGKAAGATGWIVKPFDPEKLTQTIRRVL